MILAPRHFVRFLDGRYGSVQRIAFVPGELTRQIGTLESHLLIERSYAQKLLQKHRLTYQHFQMIQPTIERGYAIIDGGRNLVFAYDDQEQFHAVFRLAIKTNAAKNELWLRTFHRIDVRQMNSMVRRFRLIKEHATREQQEPE